MGDQIPYRYSGKRQFYGGGITWDQIGMSAEVHGCDYKGEMRRQCGRIPNYLGYLFSFMPVIKAVTKTLQAVHGERRASSSAAHAAGEQGLLRGGRIRVRRLQAGQVR